MDYFKILNLVREPFSNSPEPDLFFQSPKHVRCLQNIELAIRLRRGLNVVLGHVGTGKTTLCRRLIAQFAETNQDADGMETHLLMDPSFSTTSEFLHAVSMTFGIDGKQGGKAAAHSALTDWELKENIKDYLFKKGVEEGKNVILIIDEGQKLPDFCLEILREFLNYETNENKLLQIVIFAQPEFKQVLKRMENVSDRINLLYVLEPLNFKETRDMIRFRLAQASEAGYTPMFFTRPGLLAIYWATGGYPRKIITLCHQAILTMIIQNRSRAGWFLVRSCAARLASAGGRAWLPRMLRWVSVLVAVSAILLIFLPIQPLPTNSIKVPTGPGQDVAKQNPSTDQTVKNEPTIREDNSKSMNFQAKTVQKDGMPQKSTRESQTALETVRYEKPRLLGKLALKNGRTIWWLLTDFYGEYNSSILKAITQANPHIKNLNRVQAGELIHLPALSIEKNPLEANRYWVRIVASKNLEEVYELYRTHKLEVPSLRFLSYWNPRQGMVFAIIIKEGFPDEAAARQQITKLPGGLAFEADVFKNLEQDTVFFTR